MASKWKPLLAAAKISELEAENKKLREREKTEWKPLLAAAKGSVTHIESSAYVTRKILRDAIAACEEKP